MLVLPTGIETLVLETFFKHIFYGKFVKKSPIPVSSEVKLNIIFGTVTNFLTSSLLYNCNRDKPDVHKDKRLNTLVFHALN